MCFTSVKRLELWHAIKTKKDESQKASTKTQAPDSPLSVSLKERKEQTEE
jgi:hypothetical protein